MQLGDGDVADDRHDVPQEPPLDGSVAAQFQFVGMVEIGADQGRERHRAGRVLTERYAGIDAGLEVPASLDRKRTSGRERHGRIAAELALRSAAVGPGVGERPCFAVRQNAQREPGRGLIEERAGASAGAKSVGQK